MFIAGQVFESHKGFDYEPLLMRTLLDARIVQRVRSVMGAPQRLIVEVTVRTPGDEIDSRMIPATTWLIEDCFVSVRNNDQHLDAVCVPGSHALAVSISLGLDSETGQVLDFGWVKLEVTGEFLKAIQRVLPVFEHVIVIEHGAPAAVVDAVVRKLTSRSLWVLLDDRRSDPAGRLASAKGAFASNIVLVRENGISVRRAPKYTPLHLNHDEALLELDNK